MCACWSDFFFILSKLMRKDYLIRLFYAAVGRNLHMNVQGRSGEFLRNCQAQIYLKFRQVKVQEEFNFYFIVQKETRVCMRFSSFALNFFKTHLGSDDAKGKNTILHLLLQSSKVFQFFTSLQKFFFVYNIAHVYHIIKNFQKQEKDLYLLENTYTPTIVHQKKCRNRKSAQKDIKIDLRIQI